MEVQKIKLADIFYDEDFNCRGKIVPIDVVDLANDIKEHGLLQPIILAPCTDRPGKLYKIVAGFRRYTAHRVNESETIDAIVREDLIDETKARMLNFSENLQRVDLSITQEAHAVAKLLALGLNRSQVAKGIGKSDTWVQIRTNLLHLPEEIQQDVALGIIKQTQIRDLYSIYIATNQRSDPESPLVHALKKIKDARLAGKSITVKVKKPKPETKEPKTRGEMQSMMDHMQQSVGNGLWTRSLAWACGNISNDDMFRSLKDYAEMHGLNYAMPTVIQ